MYLRTEVCESESMDSAGIFIRPDSVYVNQSTATWIQPAKALSIDPSLEIEIENGAASALGRSTCVKRCQRTDSVVKCTAQIDDTLWRNFDDMHFIDSHTSFFTYMSNHNGLIYVAAANFALPGHHQSSICRKLLACLSHTSRRQQARHHVVSMLT
jgi:hypothetical protein